MPVEIRRNCRHIVHVLKRSALLHQLMHTPQLTRGRMLAALAVALAADAVQLALGPLGWTFADEIIDVFTMALLSWLIGFHMLFLPTFAVEFIPVVDMLPTWTACTIAVIALHKRAQRNQPMASANPVPPTTPPPMITKSN
jgi:hypothetical protein